MIFNGEKCIYNKYNLVFFGYVFSDKGMLVDLKKVEVIIYVVFFINVVEVRSFLGLIGFCFRFIFDYVILIEFLKEFIRKGITW